MRAALRRSFRIAACALAAAVVVVALCAVLLPMVVRGPRLGRVVARLLPPIQGQIQLGGGRLGPFSLFSVALGRPTAIHLQDLRILDPEGVEVFWAAEIRAAVQLEREPLRLVIHELRPGQSRWRLARMRTRPGVGFTAAFLPPRRPRPLAAPGAPTPAARPDLPGRPPARAGGPRFQVAIASAHLDGTTAVFDFPGWGLELADIKATGSFWAALPVADRPPIGFEVRQIDARGGGSLRILDGAYASRVPFDRARLDWIGTPASAPADLLLLVAAATTGRSQLSGRAQFSSLFAPRWRGGPASGAATAGGQGRGGPRFGMEIDADWERAGDALTAVAAGRGLSSVVVTGDDAHVEARFRGAFRELEGRFSASGLDVEAAGFRLRDLGLDLRLRGPPTQVALERLTFRSPAGGSVQGWGRLDRADARVRLRLEELATSELLPRYLRPLAGGIARGWIGARADLRASSFILEGMDFTLERARRGPLPRTFRLRAGGSANDTPVAPEDDVLLGNLEGVRYQRGTLTVRRATAQAFGAQMIAAVTLGPPEGGRRGGAPRLDASMLARDLDLRRMLPMLPLAGTLALAAHARGPLDDLVTQVRFALPASLVVFDQPYTLPPRLDLRVQGDVMQLQRFELGPPGGGRLAVAGKLVFDREVALDLDLVGHRVDRLPLLARRLAGVQGLLSGRLRLRGGPRTVALGGQIDLDARAVPLHRLLPAVPGLGQAGLQLAGDFALTLDPQRPLAVSAELRTLHFAYGCADQRSGPSAADAGCVRFENGTPLRIRSRGGLDLVELERTRLRSGESDIAVAGKLAAGQLDAQVEGRLAVGLFAPLYRRSQLALQGVVQAALQARGPARAPRLGGTLEVLEPLVARHRSGRIELRVTEGMLTLDEHRLRASGLVLSGHGLKLRLDGDLPAGRGANRDSPFRLLLAGELDAAVLARSFPEVVASASGRLEVQGRLEGTLADPHLDGEATFGALAARLHTRGLQIFVHPGRLQARQNLITAEALTVDVTPGGRLILGPPGRPVRVQLAQLVPFVLGELQLPVVGRNLHLDLPWLTLEQGALDVDLRGDASQGPLRLTGRVELGAGRYRPARQPRPGPGSPVARVARRLPRSMRPATLPVLLDVQVVSNGERFVIDPGWLPDLHFGLDVQVRGTAVRPQVKWEAAPRGLYSRLVLLLYRLFS